MADDGLSAGAGHPESKGASSRAVSNRAILPAAAMALAVSVAVLLINVAVSYQALVLRSEAGAVLCLGLGVALRSERLVAVSTAPALLGLIAGMADGAQASWGSPLLAGCLWFLAVEAALGSIEWSGGLRLSPSVIHTRLLDVAMVVAVAAATGLVGFLVASAAPTRTLAVQVLLVGAVLVGLMVAARHLASTSGQNGRPQASS